MVAMWNPEAVTSTRVGNVVQRRDNLSELLAHDLKSPLAAIAMNLDFALDELGDDAPSATREALADCRQSNQRAVAILTDMVDALHLASGEQRPKLGLLDAQARVAGAVRRLAAEAASRGVRLTWSAQPTTVRGDGDLLDRALDRLLERGLRHVRVGGTIDVTLTERTIVIGVSPAEPAAGTPVQEPTVRSLGTHFAEAAMRAQGGAVLIDTNPDGGVRFVVALPA
jgi:signal transduction histidine kinase